MATGKPAHQDQKTVSKDKVGHIYATDQCKAKVFPLNQIKFIEYFSSTSLAFWHSGHFTGLTADTKEEDGPDVLFSSTFSTSPSSQNEPSVIAETPLSNKKTPSLIDRKTSLSPVNRPTTASGAGGQLHEELSAPAGVDDGRMCTDSSCFPGVPCEPTSSGHFKCGRCPNGYRGDGITCTG